MGGSSEESDGSQRSEGWSSTHESEEREEPVPGYIIDEEDLMVCGTRFPEIEFLRRGIEYYPPRKRPIAIDFNTRHFVKMLKLKMVALRRNKALVTNACGNTKLHYVTLSSIRRKRIFSRKRKPKPKTNAKPPLILKLWMGTSRQLIDVREFSIDTIQEVMLEDLNKYVGDNWGFRHPRYHSEHHEDFTKFFSPFYDLMCKEKGVFIRIQSMSMYELERSGISLMKTFGWWVYRMWVVIILVEDRVAKKMKYLVVSVLETFWVQRLDTEIEMSIRPSPRALEEIMFSQPRGPPMKCVDCAQKNIIYLNEIDLHSIRFVSLALFAVAHHNFPKGAKRLNFVGVLEATFQQVSGYIIELRFSATDDEANLKIYRTKAYMIPWLQFFELTPLTQVEESCLLKTCCCGSNTK